MLFTAKLGRAVIAFETVDLSFLTVDSMVFFLKIIRLINRLRSFQNVSNMIILRSLQYTCLEVIKQFRRRNIRTVNEAPLLTSMKMIMISSRRLWRDILRTSGLSDELLQKTEVSDFAIGDSSFSRWNHSRKHLLPNIFLPTFLNIRRFAGFLCASVSEYAIATFVHSAKNDEAQSGAQKMPLRKYFERKTTTVVRVVIHVFSFKTTKF